MLRVNQIQDLKDNFSREDEAIRKNKMEVLEMKNSNSNGKCLQLAYQ